MRICFFQHVEFETPGTMINIAYRYGFDVEVIHLFDNDHLPGIEEFDLLVILGGPMNIYDEKNFPFLKQEKDFIRKSITANKMILGMCLGAQLIADILGADIYKNNKKEIGWFSVKPNRHTESDFLDLFPEEKLPAFHWHSDTFDLPVGALQLFSSEATLNQGFMFGEKVLALQFHWEITPESINNLIQNDSENLLSEKFVQSTKEMLNAFENFNKAEQLMDKTLKYFDGLR